MNEQEIKTAEEILSKHSKSYGTVINNPIAIVKATEALEAMQEYVLQFQSSQPKEQPMEDIIEFEGMKYKIDNSVHPKDIKYTDTVYCPSEGIVVHPASCCDMCRKVTKVEQPLQDNEAVGFAEWIGEQHLFYVLQADNKRMWHKMVGNSKARSTTELYEQYKKSKI